MSDTLSASPLTNPVFRRLFSAQVIALLGTGLMTVALGLLAYDLAGASAGAVLGAAYTLKMTAYVGLSPVAGALVARMNRKHVLIVMDLLRAAVALALPFVTEIWQIYVLIFLLQSGSATFTPAFQAVIPDILPDERQYTRALSLSRLAYDLENLLSPAIAGLVLSLFSFHWLFSGTVAGFAVSALLVATVAIPATSGNKDRPFRERLTRGTWIYLNTPRLRGLLALNFAAATTGAFVIVNSVVAVRATFGLGDAQLALAMAAFGAGSMVAALCLPRLLDHVADRAVMVTAAILLSGLTLTLGLTWSRSGPPEWSIFLGLWALAGLLYSAILTPSGRLLRRSANPDDRPAIFTAQFALSHACWLVTYPLAGWAGDALSLGTALVVLGIAAFLATVLGILLWRDANQTEFEHDHPDLPADHPHLKAHHGQRHHTHAFVIDDEHRSWPTHG
ncbi:MFS transporter [Shimia biformata]|uniref:MFS transporter n=1 Tax=Shimia biformata TaxID=1294299 RepID=UPI00194E8FE5|nr:MFS transporter [Shimia biformata]